ALCRSRFCGPLLLCVLHARVLSLVGGVVTFIGMATISIMVLLELEDLIPAALQDHWLLVLFITSLGAVVLIIGQWCRNGLFKVRGKDSILALRTSPDSRNSYGMTGTGYDFGGDGGSSD
ncbi:hypothetical protein, partial [Sulfitobacter sp.]|uniref:hypothetical protein n=1 Tax=Sulfitobacter sp. TaxID=1903071 RepID=UPI0030031307